MLPKKHLLGDEKWRKIKEREKVLYIFKQHLCITYIHTHMYIVLGPIRPRVFGNIEPALLGFVP